MLTKESLKAHIGGLQAALKFETVEPFVVFAERWFRDQVGQELLTYLTGLQNPQAGTPDADLLYLAQSCMSWKAYELAFPHLKLRAGDLGLQKVNSQNTVAVAKWEYVDSREANLAMLDLALENFWQTVEQTRPMAWTTSTAYKKRQRIWIRSASELAQYIPTLGRKSRLFDQLVTYILRAEQVYIKPMLTESVYTDQKAKWSNPAYTLTDAEQTLLETIRPALAHMALYEAYPYLPLTLDTTGITERRSKDGTLEEVAPNSDSKNNQKRQLYLDGQFYLAQLQAFLKETATASQWPGYYQANLATDTDSAEPDFTHQSLVIL
ncbi:MULTISPECIES: DUF6712 family protein [unclassified Spirosoma]|uniref:DUF6712 family protein n=1 Tax=unclassified Spirosoma TaxID=2621999 RepID=UPI0009687F19|nr:MULTISPECIES: DUF6712 family protein [unclassified Spirosoma]MBN8820770.1 hypothetical protein [Spirosoma sp.]OJW76362.1 MAG: hypothetical protein BGO59_22850 [Spirosoma sp. 48-14]